MPEANCCGIQVRIQDGPISLNFTETELATVNFSQPSLTCNFVEQSLACNFQETHIHVNIETTDVFVAYVNKLGSDLTGSNGDANRTYTLGNVKMVLVDNQFLHPETDYTIVDDVITFLHKIWDDQRITLWLA
jgi:hypothetical protein